MTEALSTAREALLAQLLQDVDELVARVEALDQAIAASVETAVRDAAGQAFLGARLELEATIGEQRRRLTEAGRYAAALVGNALRENAAMVSPTLMPARRRAALAVWTGGIACVGGMVGAFLTILASRHL